MELVHSFCKPDKFYQFLQPSINFIGFINVQKEEDYGVAIDDMLEENIEVAYTRDPNLRDNHKVMKEASGKTKNALNL